MIDPFLKVALRGHCDLRMTASGAKQYKANGDSHPFKTGWRRYSCWLAREARVCPARQRCWWKRLLL